MSFPIKDVTANSIPLSKVNGEGLPLGWFSIPWQCVQDVNERRRLTGKWCKITQHGNSIYRVLRFRAGDKGINTEVEPTEFDIALDYDGWNELCDYSNEAQKKPMNITITECNALDIIKAYCHHPDPTHRIAAILAVISLVLGILSFGLSVIFGPVSLMLQLCN